MILEEVSIDSSSPCHAAKPLSTRSRKANLRPAPRRPCKQGNCYTVPMEPMTSNANMGDLRACFSHHAEPPSQVLYKGADGQGQHVADETVLQWTSREIWDYCNGRSESVVSCSADGHQVHYFLMSPNVPTILHNVPHDLFGSTTHISTE